MRELVHVGRAARAASLIWLVGAMPMRWDHCHLANLHDRHGLDYVIVAIGLQAFTCLSEDYSGRRPLVDDRAGRILSSGLLPEALVVYA